MTPIQVKWLHNDGFRRFELEEPTFASLVEAIKSRNTSFQGRLCYTDAEDDKIMVTCELDFRDMLKYFRKGIGDGAEVVIKIQTNDCQIDGVKSGEGPQTAASSASVSKQKTEVIELLESADERNSPEMVGGANSAKVGSKNEKGTASTPTSQLYDNVVGYGLRALVREINENEDNKEAEHQNPGENEQLQPGHSSWFGGIPPEFGGANLNWNGAPSTTTPGMATANVMCGAGVDVGMVNGLNEVASAIGGNNTPIIDDHRRMWSKRKSVSNLITCSLCATAVTNEHSSLKLHVNLHHLKLPIFACKYCWKVEHKFSRANMFRHMQREHQDRDETDFEHNFPKYRTELVAKIDECFPEAAAERRKQSKLEDYNISQ